MTNEQLPNEKKITDPEQATLTASDDDQALGPDEPRNPFTAQAFLRGVRRFCAAWLLAGCPAMGLAFGVLWWYHEGSSVLTNWETFWVHGFAQAATQAYLAYTE